MLNIAYKFWGCIYWKVILFHLCSHNVGPCERGDLPARDSKTDDGPNQAKDPEGHTDNLDSNRSHSKEKTKNDT